MEQGQIALVPEAKSGEETVRRENKIVRMQSMGFFFCLNDSAINIDQSLYTCNKCQTPHYHEISKTDFHIC